MQSSRGTLHKSDLFNVQIKAFSMTTTNFKDKIYNQTPYFLKNLSIRCRKIASFKDIPIEYEAFLKKRIQASNTSRKQSLYLIIL